MGSRLVRQLIIMANPRSSGLKIGSLIAREEAPTMPYRVSSKQGPDRFHALPYQSQGREVAIVVYPGSIIAGDGSVWHKAKATATPATPRRSKVKPGLAIDKFTGAVTGPTPPAQLDKEIRETLAARAIAAGFEPETEEGGRAMMQSITMADIRAGKPVTSRLAPGTLVTYTLQYIGGSTQENGVVSWDDGRGNVSIKTKHGGDGIMRGKRNSAGDLIVYG